MKYYLIAFILIVVGSCQSNIAFDSFDVDTWKKDRNGCQGSRMDLLPDLLNEQEKIIGLNQKSVSRSLGRPDRQELYVRNQKFFIYFVDPSASCSEQIAKKQPRQLHLRFDAIGKVNEISVQY